MAARYSSSAILRSALAAHVGLSATSLLCSAFGPSQFQSPTPSISQDQQHQTSPPTRRRNRDDMASVCAALPWLDQLHDTIAGMYVGGGVNNHRCIIGQHSRQNVMVQIGEDVSFENPIVSCAGLGEVERAFRGRLLLHLQSDVKTVLECVNVEASEDSICGGEATATGQRGPQLLDGASPSSPASLVGIQSANNTSSSPPKVEVTYRLSQQYGTFFSHHSLLVVTVRVRRGSSQKEVRRITPQKVAVPLATSGFTPRAASTVAAAATGVHAGPATVALARAASRMVAATKGRQHAEEAGRHPSQISSPLVAEVVRIEERWNGVQLLHVAPFRWSRRLNGLVAGSAAFLFFH